MKLVSLALFAFASISVAQTTDEPQCLGGWLISAQPDSVTLKFNEKILTYRITPETELWRRGVDINSPLEFVAGDDITIECAATPAADGVPIATIIASALKDDVVAVESHNIREIRVCIGDLVDIQPSVITLKNDNGVCVVRVPPGQEIWRGKVYHDTGALRIGDSVATRSTVSFPSGELTAELVEANVTKTEGMIVSAAKDFIVVNQYPGADPDSAYAKGHITVLIDGDTEFEQGSAADLKKGVDIMAVGLDLGPTQFQATRVWVYRDEKANEGKNAVKPPVSKPQ